MVFCPTGELRVGIHQGYWPIQLRSPSSRNLHNRKYLLVKGEAQYYQEFVNLVELTYGKCSDEISVFKIWHRACKEQRLTVWGIKNRVRELFKDQGKLLLNFYITIVPYLYPLATKDEVDRANQFIKIVKSTFPNNWYTRYSVTHLVLRFQDGKLTLEGMTVEMLELLEYKDELVKAYMKFVPQSKNVVAGIVIPRKLFSYLSRIVIIVAFGLGLCMMNKRFSVSKYFPEVHVL